MQRILIFGALFMLGAPCLSQTPPQWRESNCRSTLHENFEINVGRNIRTANAMACAMAHQKIVQSSMAAPVPLCTCETSMVSLGILRNSTYKVELKCSPNIKNAEQTEVKETWTANSFAEVNNLKNECETKRLGGISSLDACAAWMNTSFLPEDVRSTLGIVANADEHSILTSHRVWTSTRVGSKQILEATVGRPVGHTIWQKMKLEFEFGSGKKIQSVRVIRTPIDVGFFSTRAGAETWTEAKFEYPNNQCRPVQLLRSSRDPFEMLSCPTLPRFCTLGTCDEHSRLRNFCKGFTGTYFPSPADSPTPPVPATAPAQGTDG